MNGQGEIAMEQIIEFRKLIDISREYQNALDSIIKLLQLKRDTEAVGKLPGLTEVSAKLSGQQNKIIDYFQKKYDVKIDNFETFLSKYLADNIQIKELNREFLQVMKLNQQKLKSITAEIEKKSKEIQASLNKISDNKEVLYAYSFPQKKNLFDKKG